MRVNLSGRRLTWPGQLASGRPLSLVVVGGSWPVGSCAAPVAHCFTSAGGKKEAMKCCRRLGWLPARSASQATNRRARRPAGRHFNSMPTSGAVRAESNGVERTGWRVKRKRDLDGGEQLLRFGRNRGEEKLRSRQADSSQVETVAQLCRVAQQYQLGSWRAATRTRDQGCPLL